MDLMDVLRAAQGGAAIKNVASSFGLQPAQAEAALAALVPEVGRAVERNTLSRGGLADVVAAMGDPRYRRALDDPAALKSPQMQQAGVDLLERLLGNKDKSRAVAAHAAQASGLSEGLIKMLLPYLIPMIIGGLGKATSGGLGDILSKIPGMPAGSASGGAGHSTDGGFGGGTFGGGYAPAPAPRMGQGPLPLPGEHTPLGHGSNPYSDLSDTIRRGGQVAAGGGALAGIIRSLLGSLLGFQNRGALSWLIRMVVLRYGWSILRFVLGRVFLRR